jgi:NADH-quinone oxidoreductase subunit J
VSLFIIFGALALGAGIGMVFQRNAVHAALLLVLNLISIAVLFLSLGAEFLFVAQIIVYAGAIVVLFLFVIMLLGVDRSEMLLEPRRFQIRQIVLAMIFAIPLVGALFAGMLSRTLVDPVPEVSSEFGSAESIGQLLFGPYLVPFELTALLLVVAAIGALMLAKRRL